MVFIIAFAAVILLCFLLSKQIKKYSWLFYLLAAALAAAGYFIDIHTVPEFVANYIAPLVTNCILGTAVWSVVMWTGALPNGTKAIKTLMPIRGELSIIAAILTIGHILRYGLNYLNMLFNGRASSDMNFLLSFIVAVILVLIMTPLTVISIKKIRKKIKPKTWKNLQRFAYGFYLCTYLHIILTSWKTLSRGNISKFIDIVLYSMIFLSYAVFRIRKVYLQKKKPENKKFINGLAAVLSFVCIAGVSAAVFPYGASDKTTPVKAERPAVSVTSRSMPESSASPIQNSVVTSEINQVSKEEISEVTSVPESSAESSKIIKQSSSQQSKEEAKASSQTSQNTQSSVIINQQSSPEISENSENSTVQIQQSSVIINQQSSLSEAQFSQVQVPQQQSHLQTSTAPKPESSKAESSVPVQQSSAQPEPEPAPEPIQQSSEEPAPVINRIYNDGTYTASAYGYDGNITITLTIVDDTITSIDSWSDEEDLWYFDQSKDIIISRILASQSADVDAVAGSTYSSAGIMSAVKSALEAAKK